MRSFGLQYCIGLAAIMVAGPVLPGLSATSQAWAEEALNIYSSRHYDTDEAFYQNFTEQTGIEINRIDGNADELIERILAEGEASPADILITVDAGRLWRAEEAGIFDPLQDEALEAAIPDALRHPDGLWFGFSSRVRMIVYNPDRVDGTLVQNYEDLADEALRGEVCIRSSTNIYQLSLLASLIDHDGSDEALAWAQAVVANFARQPEGNDTAQITAVATGECGVALANSYYLARLGNADDPEKRSIFDAVEYVFPNQDNRGAHVNISGAGIVKGAPNRDNAIQFLRYMASDEAQIYFSDGNNEYTVVEGVKTDNPALNEMGPFKADEINVEAYGRNQAEAQLLYSIADWR